MINFKHTPGPWVVDFLFRTSNNNVAISSFQHHALAQVIWKIDGEVRSIECEANAKLISAAPDLLASLQGMLNVWPYMECNQTKAARDAIAKATGNDDSSSDSENDQIENVNYTLTENEVYSISEQVFFAVVNQLGNESEFITQDGEQSVSTEKGSELYEVIIETIKENLIKK